MFFQKNTPKDKKLEVRKNLYNNLIISRRNFKNTLQSCRSSCSGIHMILYLLVFNLLALNPSAKHAVRIEKRSISK
jgi:hypothetical protein